MRKIYIGSRFKLWRQRRGLTQADLVRTTGLPSGYMSELEANKKEPGTGALAAIAQGLNIPLEALTDGNSLLLSPPISMLADGDDAYLIDPRQIVLRVSSSGVSLVDIDEIPSTARKADIEHLGRAFARLLQSRT